MGGYSDMITLPNIGKSGNIKNKKNSINYYAVSFGSTIELEYRVVEEGGTAKKLNVTLNSGDAFIATSVVKEISYQVLKTTNIHQQ